ncbi:hypothetical protein B0H16DRAFT_1571554 [Mycena metata]|uniref:DUF6535 domain-containing protein n=1 Tax=Mycena metata TaxID=1033252 RepID=A0AAD7I9E2_9AGAR|nr:hypothetical protein B0H16DRAFT_1571554 [Mycena metata]
MDGQTLSAFPDNDRLVKAIEVGFSELLQRHEEQTEKLCQAVEALKPKPPATDKTTTFWNLYKILADEHDKEIQQRYGTDLDASLIFAGLFSAVESAFIIQIQPEIQPDGTPPLILISQSLLYVSLGCTLLAALFAVFGKQWLMYYSTAGDKGTLEARGLRRQRKLDGLRKWKFDMVMQLFPLLLQFGLLLFGGALSVYLRTIHPTLSLIALSVTSFGLMSYLLLLTSAIVSPDSPFRTPVAPLVTRFIPEGFWTNVNGLFCLGGSQFHRFIQWLIPSRASYDILPSFGKPKFPKTKQQRPGPLFRAPFPEPSVEVPAISWVLETSTDPDMLTAAAQMAVVVQWPAKIDLNVQMTRLRASILACFESPGDKSSIFNLTNIRPEMSFRAIQLGRAYSALRCVNQPQVETEPRFVWFQEDGMVEPELENVIRILEGKPDLVSNSNTTLAAKWAFHVIPSLHYRDFQSKSRSLEYFLNKSQSIEGLDSAMFADFLFCVLAFISPINFRDIGWLDKSEFRIELFEHLFATIRGSQSGLVKPILDRF